MPDHPSSPPRLRPYVPGHLSAEQQRVYDLIAGGPRGTGPPDFPLCNADGSLTGPFNALVAAGSIGAAVQAVGAELRYRGTLADLERELTILLVGRHWNADFEFYAHERVASRLGLAPAIIADVAAGRQPELGDGRLAAVYAVASEILATETLGDETFRAAAAALGERDLVELVLVVGYYTLLAQLLNAFAVGLPAGEHSAFLEPRPTDGDRR